MSTRPSQRQINIRNSQVSTCDRERRQDAVVEINGTNKIGRGQIKGHLPLVKSKRRADLAG
jgi:hypothetical protein